MKLNIITKCELPYQFISYTSFLSNCIVLPGYCLPTYSVAPISIIVLATSKKSIVTPGTVVPLSIAGELAIRSK